MRKFILFSILPLLLFGCKKDIDELNKIRNGDFEIVDWEPTFVAPLIDTRTTLGEVYTQLDSAIKDLEDDSLFLSINDDDVFEIEYRFPFKSPSLKEFYEVPRASSQLEVVIPQQYLDAISVLPVGFPITSSIFDTTLLFDIEPQYGALLEYVEVSGGEINIDYSHNFNQDLGMVITLRSITEKGTNDTMKLEMLGTALNPTSSVSRNIDNHNIKLVTTDLDTGEEIYNQLEIHVAMKGKVTNATLSGDRFIIDFSIGDYIIDYVQGYLGAFDVNLPSGEFTIDIFDKIDLNGIYFKEPSINLDIKSTLGLPMRLTIDTLAFGYESNELKSLGLDGDIIDINGLNDRSEFPNNPALSDYLIDNTSQLDELLTSEPQKLIYNFNVSSVPSANPDKYNFFLLDTSHVAVDVTANLPTNFSVFDYQRTDSIEYSISDTLWENASTDSIVELFDKAALKIVFENQLPFDVLAQAYIVDSVSGLVLDQVFDDGFHTVLANADIQDGIAQKGNEIVTVIEMNQDKFKSLVNGTHIVIETKAATSGANASTDPNDINYVKILSSYEFGIRAGVLVKLKIPVDVSSLGDSK